MLFEQLKLCNDELYWRIVTDYDSMAVGSFKLSLGKHESFRGGKY